VIPGLQRLQPPLRCSVLILALLLAPLALAQTESERFNIQRFVIEGNTLLSPAEIEALLRPFTGPGREYGDVQRALESGVSEGDTLQTVQGTYARLRFDDGAEVVLRPDSQMKIEEFKYNEAQPESDSMFFNLLKGGLRSVTGLLGRRNRDRVRVAAPNATIGIRGTHFGLLFCDNNCGNIPMPGGGAPPNGLHVDVVDGSVSISNNAGQQVLNAGQFGYVRDTTTAPAAVPSQQGIQVTMPLSIARNAGSGGTVGKGRNDAECAIP
jgi:hypothetical protein